MQLTLRSGRCLVDDTISGGNVRNLLCAAVCVAVVAASGCSRDFDGADAAADYANRLSAQVDVDAVMGHLQRLQDIADANGGNRATGTTGFDKSVEYVSEALRDKSFDVTTPEFEMQVLREKSSSLTVAGRPVDASAIDYTMASPKDGATGPLVVVPAGDAPGCTPDGYANLPVRGAVVVVDRGACYLIDKATAAAAAGAVALVIANNADEEAFSAGMSAGDDSRIPVLSVSKAVGEQLKRSTGEATVTIDAMTENIKTHNVIAQTRTGATDNVVMVGGHLDSVAAGPGINDNGTGVAAVLETALQMGSSPDVANAVRFAFWSGEEEGLFGSFDYVHSLDEDALKDIALYLNFDMLGSPNTCYFTSDANQSSPPDPDIGLQLIPEGSPGIERTLVAALEAQGATPEDGPLDGRSDFDSFTRAGVPIGNLDTGADEKKSAEQVQQWGGQIGKACDPNYHSAKDTVDNVNTDALAKTSRVVGYATGLYAQDQSGHNGVPVRADRTRHVPDDE
jgi:Zn-dependent M28 family amino/carboxypeptidase